MEQEECTNCDQNKINYAIYTEKGEREFVCLSCSRKRDLQKNKCLSCFSSSYGHELYKYIVHLKQINILFYVCDNCHHLLQFFHPQSCIVCDKPGVLTCNACNLIFYCGKECVDSYYDKHLRECRKPLVYKSGNICIECHGKSDFLVYRHQKFIHYCDQCCAATRRVYCNSCNSWTNDDCLTAEFTNQIGLKMKLYICINCKTYWGKCSVCLGKQKIVCGCKNRRYCSEKCRLKDRDHCCEPFTITFGVQDDRITNLVVNKDLMTKVNEVPDNCLVLGPYKICTEANDSHIIFAPLKPGTNIHLPD